MYKLPNGINLDFFVKKTLLQICVGVHDLIFNFDDDLAVTVTSSIGYVDSDGKSYQSDNFCEIIATLVKLLNHSVVYAKGEVSGTLTLKFDNGMEIAIYDDSEQYESYVINKGDQIIVV